MPKLVLGFSGKKQSGKTSACKLFISLYINQLIGKERFTLDCKGNLIDNFANDIIHLDHFYFDEKVRSLLGNYSISLCSFADPLKDFVHNTFGIEYHLLYGTDVDKNTKTHIYWENIAPHIRTQYCQRKRGTKSEYLPASGSMTIREILQVFGTDICRKMDENCWARALYNKISHGKDNVYLISDARFANEITVGASFGAKLIRLLRQPHANEDQHISETALDNFPLGEYTKVLDNSNMTLKEKNKKLSEWFNPWIKEML